MTTSGPRVVVVADGWGDLSPTDAAGAIAGGWARQATHAQVRAFASHGGGAGFAATVCSVLGGVCHPTVVPGPAGDPVPGTVVTVDGERGRTAYLDTAEVAGRHLVAPERLRDPNGLSSAGIGALLRHARELGARRIVVGVGDLACHDGGAGLLTELGAGTDLAELPQVRRDWADVELVAATTTEAPLLGFHGASATLGDLGVPPEVTQRLETTLGELTDRVNALLPPARDLLTGLPRRPEREPGAGAGGGVAYALQVLGARTTTAGRLLLDELAIRPHLAGALVVLVTDSYDYTTVHDGVVAETARAALEIAAPTVVLAREVAVGRREGMSLGVSGSYDARPGEGPADLAARVARTWTPAPPPVA